MEITIKMICSHARNVPHMPCQPSHRLPTISSSRQHILIHVLRMSISTCFQARHLPCQPWSSTVVSSTATYCLLSLTNDHHPPLYFDWWPPYFHGNYNLLPIVVDQRPPSSLVFWLMTTILRQKPLFAASCSLLTSRWLTVNCSSDHKFSLALTIFHYVFSCRSWFWNLFSHKAH